MRCLRGFKCIETERFLGSRLCIICRLRERVGSLPGTKLVDLSSIFERVRMPTLASITNGASQNRTNKAYSAQRDVASCTSPESATSGQKSLTVLWMQRIFVCL